MPQTTTTANATTQPNGRVGGGGGGAAAGVQKNSNSNPSDRRLAPLQTSPSGASLAEDGFSGPPSESYRESSVESISTTTSTLSECTTPSILPLSSSSSSAATDATKDLISSSFSSIASHVLWDEVAGDAGTGVTRGGQVTAAAAAGDKLNGGSL